MIEPVFEDVPTDIARDRWGRPLVIPPSGGKPVAYTRCTTYVGCLEDTFNLTKWKQRQVARGLSQRPDLQLRVASLGPEPEDKDAAKPWKRSLDEICESAMESAGGSSWDANIGTALHALTDRLDRGLDLGVVPDQYKPHLKAYEAATKELTAVGIERFTVNDELKIGGTFDRLLQVDGHNKLIIGDTKSSKWIGVYGDLKIAMQLAVYAHSQHYDPATGQRRPLGDVNLERALIVALNGRGGTCELIWIDIARGWEAVQLATQVRAWRAIKDLTAPFSATPPALPIAPTPPVSVEAESALVVAINEAASHEELVRLWNAAGPSWQPHHTELAAARKAVLAQRSLVAVF